MATQNNTEILRRSSKQPAAVIHTHDPRVQHGGDVSSFILDLPDLHESPMQLLILRGAGSWAEVTWSEPTTTVGVQFWGDKNDGHACIFVDGEKLWQGSTQGESVTFEVYIELDELPATAHRVRVEATGQPGNSGGHDVTVAAFGAGKLASGKQYKVFLPIVQN